MKPLVDQAFWSDPDIEAAKSGVKLAALWLITNSQTSLLGVCRSSIHRFCFETALPEEALQRALEGLPRAFVRVGSAIFVRNYIRHQFGTGDKLMKNNFFVALKSLFLSVKDDDLQAVILAEYPEFQQALAKPSEGLTKPKDGKEGEGKEGIGSEEFETMPALNPHNAMEVSSEFAVMVHRDWASREGKDAAGVKVQFNRYVLKRWQKEGAQWKAGCHKGNGGGNGNEAAGGPMKGVRMV